MAFRFSLEQRIFKLVTTQTVLAYPVPDSDNLTTVLPLIQTATLIVHHCFIIDQRLICKDLLKKLLQEENDCKSNILLNH